VKIQAGRDETQGRRNKNKVRRNENQARRNKIQIKSSSVNRGFSTGYAGSRQRSSVKTLLARKAAPQDGARFSERENHSANF
jgi:hypothetical protein